MNLRRIKLFLTTPSGTPWALACGGGLVVCDGSVETVRFAGGYFDSRLKPNYYITDCQGNNVAVADSGGLRKQSVWYYPYGESLRRPSATFSLSSDNRYLFGDKEYSNFNGESQYNFGPRIQSSSVTPIFYTHDPLCYKRPWESPFIYGAANPIKYTDPTGLIVYADNWCQRGIMDGFTPEENEYIEFDANGKLNSELLSKAKTKSLNFNILKELSESDCNFRFEAAYEIKISNNTLILDGTRMIGQTLMPGVDEGSRSFDEDVHIYTSPLNNREKRATNIAHEAYGHAYFFLKQSQGFTEYFPLHTGGEMNQYIVEQDGGVVFTFPYKNTRLENIIKKVETIARKNYRKYHETK